MNNYFNDYDRYYYSDETAYLSYDGFHAFNRQMELDQRRFTGFDTYCGSSDEGYSEW